MIYITAKHATDKDRDLVIELSGDFQRELSALIVALAAAGYWNITVK